MNDSWREWSAGRFLKFWGDFLARPNAVQDPQFKMIESMYNKATMKATAKQTAEQVNKQKKHA